MAMNLARSRGLRRAAGLAIPILAALLFASPTLAQGPREPVLPHCDAPVGSIAGTVVDPSGTALEGVTVDILVPMPFTAEPGVVSGAVVAQAQTDASGAYKAEGLCDADYIVVAHQETAAGVAYGVYDADADGAPDLVTLGDAGREIAGIDIEAQAAPPPSAPSPAPCTGVGVIEGTVRLADGTVVPGAQVMLVAAGGPSSGAIGGRVVKEATTDADGKYSLGELCDGDFVLVAYAATAAGRMHGMYDADGDGTPDTVTLADGARTAQGIGIVLAGAMVPPQPPARPTPPPTAPEPGCAAVGGATGVVRDADGNGVAGAHVTVLGAADGAQAMTAADGSYAVRGLCEGAHIAVALKAEGGRLLQGVYDPDGDGAPNQVNVTVFEPVVTGVDITLQPLTALLRNRKSDSFGIPIQPGPTGLEHAGVGAVPGLGVGPVIVPRIQPGPGTGGSKRHEAVRGVSGG